MSGSSEGTPQPAVSMRRFVTVGILALVGPLAIGIAIAMTRPGNYWRVEGLGPFLAVCLALVALAAGLALLAGAAPVAIGTLSGVALAIGSIVREGSPVGALIALAAGAAGGVLADQVMRKRSPPQRGLIVLVILAVALGAPFGALARVSPETASTALSGRPVLASTTGVRLGVGHVLTGAAERFLTDTTLVRVSRRGIGSWRPETSIQVLGACALPQMIEGSDVRWYPAGGNWRPIYSGVLVRVSEIERVCPINAERVVAGIAPAGTTTIEGDTVSGKATRVPLGEDGAYVFSVDETSVGGTFARILFRDARGALLDSKPLNYGLEYADLAHASGLLPAAAPSDQASLRPVTVSRSIVTPAEYRSLCHAEPPYGDGFVLIGIVRRNDGATREVVMGSGTPLSSHHPAPDPPLVRPSDGRPCFAPD